MIGYINIDIEQMSEVGGSLLLTKTYYGNRWQTRGLQNCKEQGRGGERKMDWDPPPTPHSLELFLSYN